MDIRGFAQVQILVPTVGIYDGHSTVKIVGLRSTMYDVVRVLSEGSATVRASYTLAKRQRRK